jgi:LacI family transcriptional regulator
VLKARGIEGLVIMHAVPAIAQLPMNLEDFSVIAIGLSVRQPLPRVCLHQYQDMQTLCFELIARGYRRPGLILSHDLNERSNYQFSAAYLAISQFHLRGLRIPIFFSDESPSTQLRHWLRKHRPDAVIFHHVDTSLTTVRAEAKALGLKTPAQLGIASLDLRIGHGAPSGLRQGWETLGKRAAEAVIMRVYHGLKGPSVQPSIEMITGEWIDGGTAPTRAAP